MSHSEYPFGLDGGFNLPLCRQKALWVQYLESDDGMKEPGPPLILTCWASYQCLKKSCNLSVELTAVCTVGCLVKWWRSDLAVCWFCIKVAHPTKWKKHFLTWCAANYAEWEVCMGWDDSVGACSRAASSSSQLFSAVSCTALQEAGRLALTVQDLRGINVMRKLDWFCCFLTVSVLAEL